MTPEERTEKLVRWIKAQVASAGMKGTVIGISGGLDSAVAAVLCKRAFPRNILGLVMPCHSDPRDVEDAVSFAESFEIPVRVIQLQEVYESLVGRLEEVMETLEDAQKENGFANRMAKANVKPRLRMMTLYYFANTLDYLVVGTGNRSELTLGYFTKYGDGGVDIMPLGNIVKKEVRELAEHLGIPRHLIDKAPSAGLWPGQTDEKELGLTYENLDAYLLTGRGDEALVEKVQEMMKRSAHKRRLPPIPLLY